MIIPNKIRWRVNLNRSWSEVFYPSIVKKMAKGVNSFNDFYTITVTDLGLETLKKTFLPVYEDIVVSKNNYNLDYKNITSKMIEKIQNPQHGYKILQVYNASKMIGGCIFRPDTTKEVLFIAYRAFYKGHRHAGISLDHWIEKYMFDFAQNKGFKSISHGKDAHPFIDDSDGFRTGLALFKIRVGAKPKVLDEETDKISLGKLTSKKTETIVCFSEPFDDSYQTINIYSKLPEDEPNRILPLIKASEWAGLKINFRKMI